MSWSLLHIAHSRMFVHLQLHNWLHWIYLLLRLRSRRLKVNIIFAGMIIVLANKSIKTNGFTSWSVSSLSGYRKPLLNCVGSLSPSNNTTYTIDMTGSIHQKSKFSAYSSQYCLIETHIIYVGPLEEISYYINSQQMFIEHYGCQQDF